MARGHNARIKEQDIAYGFKVYRQTEKFEIKLENIDAHTMKIIEIIEQEKGKLQQDNLRGLGINGS